MKDKVQYVPMHPGPRDRVKEPHDVTPRWLGEGKAAVWTEPTPDEEEEAPKAIWRPCIHCHATGAGFRLVNIRFGVSQLCKECKREKRESAEAAEFDAGHNHEARVIAFLKLRRVRVQTRGKNRGMLPTKWEGE